jgi:hypothetical protein
VTLHATVVDSYKGDLKIGDKIKIRFSTDSLEGDEETRRKFMEEANNRNKGALKFAFLSEVEKGGYSCEWLDVPSYNVEMRKFLKNLAAKPPKHKAGEAAPSGGDKPAK